MSDEDTSRREESSSRNHRNWEKVLHHFDQQNQRFEATRMELHSVKAKVDSMDDRVKDIDKKLDQTITAIQGAQGQNGMQARLAVLETRVNNIDMKLATGEARGQHESGNSFARIQIVIAIVLGLFSITSTIVAMIALYKTS